MHVLVIDSSTIIIFKDCKHKSIKEYVINVYLKKRFRFELESYFSANSNSLFSTTSTTPTCSSSKRALSG